MLVGVPIGVACTSSEEAAGPSTTAGGGGRSGAGGAGGEAGWGGYGGTVTEPARGGTGGECGGVGGCQGYPAYTRAAGSGFPLADGTPVHATLRDDVGDGAERRDGVVQRGQFVIDYPRPCTCYSGGGGIAGAALYADVDGDGYCNPAVDQVYVWTVSAAGAGTHLEIALTPNTARCTDIASPEHRDLLLQAAQELCPAIGSCLGFCGSSATAPENAGSPLLCGAAGAGSDANAPAGGADASP